MSAGNRMDGILQMQSTMVGRQRTSSTGDVHTGHRQVDGRRSGNFKTIGTGARGSIGDGSTLGSNQSLYRIESRPQQEAVPRIWLSQLRTRKDGSIIPDEDNVMTALKTCA